jgi:hypothetical protein
MNGRGVILAWLPAAAARGAWAAENRFVQSGGEVLRERMQIPWYDAEADALRPITLRTPWDPAMSLDWLSRPLHMVLIALGAALLLAVLWIALRALRERERGKRSHRPADAETLIDADRIEALPFLRERSQHDLLGQARRHYEQGNYSEAVIYLFSHQLVELDRTALVRLAKGKTNRQYLREVRRVRPLAQLLERTMFTFEDVFFGRRSLDRAGFEACWSQLGQFESLVAQVQAGA